MQVERILNGAALLYTSVIPEGAIDEQRLWEDCEPMLLMTPMYDQRGEKTRIYRTQAQKRATAGDDNIIFKYKDRKRKLYAWTPDMEVLRGIVQELRGWVPNKCTINKYKPNGYIVPHRDKDYITGFVPNHEFCIFSFGSPRTMLFISCTDSDDITEVLMPPHSMLVVSGQLDETHLHGGKPEYHYKKERLSLAFKMHFEGEENV